MTEHELHSSECATILRKRLDGRQVGLATSTFEERSHIPDAEVVIGKDLRSKLFEEAKSMRLFAAATAGVDHLDLAAFEERGIAVTNASGVHAPNIAEYVIGWMLAIARRFEEGLARQERREWRHYQSFGEVQGSTVCVVGMGAIGQAIVDRLAGFGVDTIGVRYTPEKGGPTDEVYGFEEIDTALDDVDYAVLACPLSEATEQLIGEYELSMLAPDGILINIGRGPIIDTDALVDTLRSNTLQAAILDVTDPEPLPEGHPLWTFNNVYITSHNAGHTPHLWDRFADILIRNLGRIDETDDYKNLENQVV